MQSEVQVFNFEANEVRTVVVNNEAWFVGKDVADTLGYSASRNALSKHVDVDDKLTHQISASGQMREMTLINESGVYSLIFGSKLDSAKRFKKWVTSEVLPSIRQTGGYQLKQLSATEMLKLQNDSILEVSEKVDRVEDKVDTYIENQAVNATDYGAISTAVTHRVHQYAAIHHIEKENRGPLFKDLNSQIKQVTGAGNRSRIKSKDYDMVIRFIDTWEPSTATKAIIEQMSLDLDETA
ncbi:BRO family protein [Leuconostoc falkenbergense]|uniref:BRO family protein n=1 Tax=Leuconostoc falkenbergense TaxID=2766470 RepID=UPI0028AF26C9|nr:BRO family protein [Leuconostoc falkenbergense]